MKRTVIQFKSVLALLMGSLLLFTSCEKEPKVQKYGFTTHASTWFVKSSFDSIPSVNDTIVNYTGSVTTLSATELKIIYAQHEEAVPPHHFEIEGILYAAVDDSGHLSYPNYIQQYAHYFSGMLKGNGDIHIELGCNTQQSGFSNIIDGVPFFDE